MAMWPFLNQRKKKAQSSDLPASPPSRRAMLFEQLVEGMGDFSDLSEHDVAVKFWAPAPAADALRELRSLTGQSSSEFFRQFLAAHCYGVYAYQVMLNRHPGLFRDFDDEIRYSLRSEEPPPGKKRVRTYFVPELGKNVAPMKVWMARRMRDDLQILADHVNLTLSNYLREIIISRLLGHGTLPMRPAMLVAEPTEAAEAWCEDREFPWREVDIDEYGRYEEGRTEAKWVDE
jgi:hypothetical protein